jgi:pre-mRNA-splicing helicase BRR2
VLAPTNCAIRGHETRNSFYCAYLRQEVPYGTGNDDEDRIDFEGSDDDASELNVDIAEDAAEPADRPEEVQVVGGSKPKFDENKVYAHEIDAVWLQRTVAAHFTDPITAQEKSTAAMKALASNANISSVEIELLEIFEWDHFPTVPNLIQNRDAIVW